jgi:hypothetical protein
MPPEVAAVLRRSYPLRTAASAAVRHRDGDVLLTAGSAAAKEDPCARA